MPYPSLREKTPIIAIALILLISYLGALLFHETSNNEEARLSLTNQVIILEVGDTFNLPFSASFDDHQLVWTSSNPTVLTVTNGVVYALSSGVSTVQVTADTGRYFDTVLIRVNGPVTLPAQPEETDMNDQDDELVVTPETPVEITPPVVSDPEPEVPIIDEPGDEVVTPPVIYTITITNETGAIITTLLVEDGAFITTSSLELPDTFKGFFLDDQTCSDEPFNLETPITEDLTLIKASFNQEAPCIQLDYIVLNGRPGAGSTLSVDVFPIGANVSISWYTSVNNRTYREIPGETESTFTVRPEDSGKFIRVYVVSDSNPPVVRYDTIKMDVFSTVSHGESGPVRIPLTDDEIASASALIDSGIIPIAYLEDLIAINSTGSHIFAGVLTTEGGLSKSYALIRDIDLSLTSGTTSLIDGTFTGTFDGNNYTLSNLTIDASTKTSIGLFSRIGGGTIQNLTLESFNVTGEDSVGLLAGNVSGENNVIENIHVTNSTISGDNEVGGLVGTMEEESNVILLDITFSALVSGDINNVGGIVGFIDEDSRVSISNITFSGSVSGINQVGGIVGFVQTNSTITLSGISNTGNVSGKQKIGGIIGASKQNLSVYFSNTSNQGDINGEREIGGLIGNHEQEINLIIRQSFNSGNISASDSFGGVGGLIGFIDIYSSLSANILIENVFNSGSIFTNSSGVPKDYAGGLIGVVFSTETSTINLEIINAYNSGVVKNINSNISPAGVLGYLLLQETAIVNLTQQAVFYLNHPDHVSISNNFIAPGAAFNTFGMALAKNLTQMIIPETFIEAGWDIEKYPTSTAIWSIGNSESGNNYTFPWLASFGEVPSISQADYDSIQSTLQLIESGYQPIGSAESFVNSIGDDLSGDYVLVSDIDLSSLGQLSGSLITGTFTGTLDGNGFTISNLAIAAPTVDNIGLFSELNGATISNLNFENTVVEGKHRVGALAGRIVGSSLTTIENVTTGFGSISSTEHRSGGLIGVVENNVNLILTNILNQHDVTDTANINTGGIIALIVNNATVTMTGIRNTGTISGTRSVGGIVGEHRSSTTTMVDVINDGTVISSFSGRAEAGGIIGNVFGVAKISLNHVTNNGHVQSKGYGTGGLLGNIGGSAGHEISISNSINNGLVELEGSYNGIGGILGFSNRNLIITLSAVSNHGNISAAAATKAGGLVGDFSITNGSIAFIDTYNVGSITASSVVGGLLGSLSNSSAFEVKLIMINSYNAGRINGSTNIGSIVGAIDNNPNVTFTDIYYLESSSTNNLSIGAITGDPTVTGSISELSDADMKTQNSFSGWNFIDTWIISPSKNNGYPTLRFEE